MKILKPIEFSDERALHAFISKNPDVIENGFKIIKNEARLDGLDRADILGLDVNDTMSVIELKANMAGLEDLMQLIGYVNYILDDPYFVYSRFAGLNKTLKSFNPMEDLRPILVAPYFSDKLLRFKNILTVNIELIQYQAFDLGNGKVGLAFSPIQELSDSTTTTFVKPTKTVEEHLARIEDPDVLAATNELIDKMRELEGVQVSATQSYIKLSIYDKYNLVSIYTYKQSLSVDYRRFTAEVPNGDRPLFKMTTIEDIYEDNRWEDIVNAHKKLLESYKQA